LILAVLVWLGRRSRLGKADWRVGAALMAVGAVAGAAITGVRGDWPLSLLFIAAAGFFLFDVRRRGGRRAEPEIPRSRMSEAEARAVLGVGPEAGDADIQAAYVRLMRAVHPDRGGTSGLAAQLNAARDRLTARGRAS
jgi:hypothetical protein